MPKAIDLAAIFAQVPLLQEVAAANPVYWKNSQYTPAAFCEGLAGFGRADVKDAETRLARFAPFVVATWPEAEEFYGIIESPVRAIPHMRASLAKHWAKTLPETLLLKMDSDLPISGSIKARGGIYEVFSVAEKLAEDAGLLARTDNYTVLATPKFKDFFGGYSLAVGSTGNLGLSIGISGAALGFKVTVHMSADALKWKKELLRRLGVTVVEYESDYSEAVAQGRREAKADPKCHFVDDEGSRSLFTGYAVAAFRLQNQLQARDIVVDNDHPLFVYLPCGVGGGPGGVAYGLKLVYGSAVRCVFVEPTQSPAMLLGLATGLGAGVCAQDFGLTNKTAADGLAVGRPSALVCSVMESLLDGVATVQDKELFKLLAMLYDTEKVKLEPSALAGFGAMPFVMDAYPEAAQATHLVWATGGSLVPSVQWQGYYARG